MRNPRTVYYEFEGVDPGERPQILSRIRNAGATVRLVEGSVLTEARLDLNMLLPVAPDMIAVSYDDDTVEAVSKAIHDLNRGGREILVLVTNQSSMGTAPKVSYGKETLRL